MKKYEFRKLVSIAGCQLTLNDDPFLSISLTIFCSGCYHHCKGCQSRALQDPKNGVAMTFSQIKSIIDKHLSLIDTVCFSGGDWIFYSDQLMKVSTYTKSLNLKNILYTGAEYEKIPEKIRENIDIVVDGKYELTKAQNSFPASTNQRIFVNGRNISPSSLPINQLINREA